MKSEEKLISYDQCSEGQIMEKNINVIIWTIVIRLSLSDPNIRQVEGLQLTVKIYEDIPKHLCGRALDNLQVIIMKIWDIFSFIKL